MQAVMLQQWASFARPFSLYLEAQQAVINTDPNWSRFGQHDQNVLSPPVIPQVYIVSGCVQYGQKQPFPYTDPYRFKDQQALKLRDPEGDVRIKVIQDGYDLMKNCQIVTLDGLVFNMNSTVRPHGLFTPEVFTFVLNRQS